MFLVPHPLPEHGPLRWGPHRATGFGPAGLYPGRVVAPAQRRSTQRCANSSPPTPCALRPVGPRCCAAVCRRRPTTARHDLTTTLTNNNTDLPLTEIRSFCHWVVLLCPWLWRGGAASLAGAQGESGRADGKGRLVSRPMPRPRSPTAQ